MAENSGVAFIPMAHAGLVAHSSPSELSLYQMAHAGIAAQSEVISLCDSVVYRVSTVHCRTRIWHVLSFAVHTTTSLGSSQSLERELVLCLLSSPADRSDRGSAIPFLGHPSSWSSRHCVFGSPRVSLREGARRAGSSSLRSRPLPCPGLALLAVAHLLLPVQRYARTWSWCLSCSRVLRSMRWRRTFRTVASHLPVFFLNWESFKQVRGGYGQIEYSSICSASTHQGRWTRQRQPPREVQSCSHKMWPVFHQDAPGPRPAWCERVLKGEVLTWTLQVKSSERFPGTTFNNGRRP